MQVFWTVNLKEGYHLKIEMCCKATGGENVECVLAFSWLSVGTNMGNVLTIWEIITLSRKTVLHLVIY